MKSKSDPLGLAKPKPNRAVVGLLAEGPKTEAQIEREAEIDRLTTPRHVFCRFCGKDNMVYSDSPQPTCDPECVRAQKVTAAMEALTAALQAKRP